MHKKIYFVISLVAMMTSIMVSCITTQPTPAPVQEPKQEDPDIIAIIQNNDLAAMEGLFKGKELINKPSSEGRYPLHLAVLNNSLDMVKLLLTMGAQPDPKDKEGKTPLRYAVDLNAFTLAKQLISGGAQIFIQDASGQTPFDIILAKNAVDRVLDAKSIMQTDSSGKYPLHIAVERFSYSGVIALLELGAQVNSRDNQGRTPLDLAFFYPHSAPAARIAAELVKANAVSGIDSFAYFVRAVRDTNFSRVRFQSGATVLHEAARNNHLGFLQFFLENNVPVDLKNDAGLTPLHLALQGGNIEAVKLLLSFKADVTMKDAEGTPVLSMTMPAQKAHSLIEILLAYNADPSVKDKHGNTALHTAIINGYSPEIVALFLTKGGKPLANSSNSDGNTALALAVSMKRYNVLKTLVEGGANPFIENKDGLSSLNLAFSDGIDAVAQLIGVLPNDIRDAAGNSFLHHAVKNKANQDIIKIILEWMKQASPKNNEGDTPLHFACVMNLRDQGVLLLSANADIFAPNARGQAPIMLALGSETGNMLTWFFTPGVVSAKDSMGNTPLHYSARAGNREGCNFLANRGADINARNKDGRTPLMTAIQYNSLTAVNTLLALGASVIVRDISGFSPLHLAVQSGALPIIQLLLKIKTLQIDLRDFNGKTPLILSVENNDIRSAELLLASGANPLAGDAQGKTSLHYSVRLSDTTMLELIAAKTSALEVRDDNGTTPLLEALYRENIKAVAFLVNAGASIHARDASGESPLSYALKSGGSRLSVIMTRATINTPDADGRSVLHVILEAKPNAAFIEQALNLGAIVNNRDALGKTALHLAVENGYLDVIKLLVSRGADIFMKDSKGTSPLLFAIGVKNQAQQSALISALLGSNPDIQDVLGDTALHYAASLGNEQAVLAMLALNPSKTILNANGETARDVAARRGYGKIAEMLK